MTADTPDPNKGELQFDRAEAAGEKPPGPVCALCQKPITAYYYEANGQVVCAACKRKVETSNVSGVAAASFMRAVFFGFLGALAGAAVYYGVLAATGYEIGLIAILVGFMVGFAVRLGAGGRGGRRYQILALSLTYLAIGGTYVPLAMRELGEGDVGADSLAAISGDTSAAAVDSVAVASLATADSLAPAGSASAAPSLAGLVIGLAALAALAVAMPILVVIFGFPQSLISALIIGFALHQAWRMNGRVKVAFTGPFKVGAAPAPGGAPGA